MERYKGWSILVIVLFVYVSNVTSSEILDELGFPEARANVKEDDCIKICGEGYEALGITCKDASAESKKPVTCECSGGDKKFDYQNLLCKVPCDGALEDSCKNKGTCEGEENESKFCKCKDGTSGDDCAVVDKCEEDPKFCGEGGDDVKCVYDENPQLLPRCECTNLEKQFDPSLKICRKPCDSSPENSCKNEGTCVEEGGIQFCNCQTGTTGDTCEVVNKCVTDPKYCGDGTDVKCVNDETGPTSVARCECTDGEKQFDNSQKICRIPCDGTSEDSCKNKGICDGDGLKFCKCKDGTSGDDCAVVDKCEADPKFCGEGGDDVKCVYDENPQLLARCECTDPKKQFDTRLKICRKPCDSSPENSCKNKGTCEEEAEGLKFCKCKDGTSGDDCTVVDKCVNEPKYCGEGKDVNCVFDEASPSLARCACTDPKKQFDTPIKICRTPCDGTSIFCKHGAKCEDGEKAKFCSCKNGTSGDDCGVIDKCSNNLQFCGENHDATCFYDETSEDAKCRCIIGRKIYDTDDKICREVCDSSEGCEKGEECWKDLEGKKTCACKQGYGGDLCRNQIGCTTEAIDKCKKANANCKFTAEKGEKCECKEKDEKYDNISNMCRSPCDVSKTDFCKYGSKCEPISESTFCKCKKGTSGSDCGTVDDCKPDKAICGTEKDVTCKYNENTEKAECGCETPSNVFDTDGKKCRKICNKNEDCGTIEECWKSVEGKKTCACKQGYGGVDCTEQIGCTKETIGECDKAAADCKFTEQKKETCQCRNSTLKYEPIKKICQIPCDVTKTDYCKHGSTCEQSGEATFCKCKKGTSGFDCEKIDDCSPEKGKCGKGGDVKCDYDVDSEAAHCKCTDGNKVFDTDKKICRQMCENSETCTNGEICWKEVEGKKTCACKDGFGGDGCKDQVECKMETIKKCSNANATCELRVNKEEKCKCRDVNKKYETSKNICQIPCEVSNSFCKYGSKCELSGEASFCKCNDGTSGDDCGVVDDCVKEKCGKEEDVECVYNETSKAAECKCKDITKAFDTNGKKCRIPCDTSKPSCKNGAKCEGEGTVKFCGCKEGTSEDDCSRVDKCFKDSNFCGKNADCSYDEKSTDKAKCECKDPSKKFVKDDKTCRVSCGDSAECKNGGQCKDGICICNKGTSGDLCDIVDACQDQNFCGNSKDVRCIFNIDTSQADCKCDDEKKMFDRAGNKVCRVPCQEGSCKNDGTCKDEGDLKFCRCKDGTSGDDCGTVNKCKENPEYCGKDAEEAQCAYLEKSPYAQCICKDKEKQFDRNATICRAPCEADKDCKHKALCKKTGDLKFCECNSDTFGDDCGEKNCTACGDLADKDCEFDEDSSKIVCKCHLDSKKFDKDKKECRSPCKDSTSCKNGANCNEFCKCLPGTRGDSCETIDKCEENLCGTDENVAKCLYDDKGKKGAYCKCTDTSTTEFDYDDKVCRKICKEDKECENKEEKCWKPLNSKKTCACEDGKGGDNCDKVLECEEALGEICEKIDAKCVFDKDAPKKATCECKENHVYDPENKACRPSCETNDDCKKILPNMQCLKKYCKCKDGYEGDECDVITGCKEKECEKADADCVFDDILKGPRCQCKQPNFVYKDKDKKCTEIFCSENPCKTGSKCVFDEERKVGVCKCDDDKKYYDYAAGVCKDPDLCILRKTPCPKNRKCEKGNCKCADNFEEDNETKECKFKGCPKSTCFVGADCSIDDGITNCKCPKEKYFDGTKCADGKCLIGDYKKKCKGCSTKVKENAETGNCEAAVTETIICDADCGYGYCLQKKGDEDYTCECISGISEKTDDKKGPKDICVLKKSVCASRNLTADMKKCECGENYKQAEDGITCVVKTCQDESIRDKCNNKQRKKCSMSWTGTKIGPNCNCVDGYVDKGGKSCIEPCSAYEEISRCLETGELCFNTVPSKNKQNTGNCRCPPTLKKNIIAPKDCSEIENNVYMLHNIPVVKTKYELADGVIDEILLGSDLITSMKTMFLSKDYQDSYLHSFKLDGNILTCSVWLQAKQNISAQLNRILNQSRSFECAEICDASLTLWPPSTFVSKQLLENVETHELKFCDDDVKNGLCGEHAACDKKTNKCYCPEGYRTLAYTIKETTQFKIQRCEDIDECMTGVHSCPGNTTCVNIPGGYECQCKPNYKKKDDPLHNREKHNHEDCYDLCTPNPCTNNGECVTNNGTIDCKCPLGYVGTFCGRSDVSLASAKKSTKVVGAVLGVILALTLIGFFVFYWRVKKKSFSEDFELSPRQDHAAETMERGPMRGVVNKSYE